MIDLWCVCSELLQEQDVREEGLDYAEWGAEISLYNPCSGETHLLNLFPFEIVRFLLLKPASLPAISVYMADLCDENNNKLWSEKILKVLKQLEELELIEHC